MDQKTKETTNREVKSSAFATLFGQAGNAAKLYAALNEEIASPEDIEFTTLQGVLFMVRKNEVEPGDLYKTNVIGIPTPLEAY